MKLFCKSDQSNHKQVLEAIWLSGLYSAALVTLRRCGALMVSALASRSSGPCPCPGWGHCVVFLGKILYTHSASLHPGSFNMTRGRGMKILKLES